jgi:organic radical activating enzyme
MLSEPSKFAVITGGEPLMNKQLPRVIKLLKDEGFEIACETNGTWPYVEGIDFVTCSPKRDANYEVDEGLWSHVSEFKYVVDQGFNFSILDRHKNRSDTVRLSLSPEFGNWKDSLSAIFDYITLHPRWRISLQTHKIMEIP